jgi:hypothetical protein
LKKRDEKTQIEYRVDLIHPIRSSKDRASC